MNDGEKVERDAVEHPLRARNSAWDGKVVRISGARNEIVAFQIIVEADDRGIRALSLRLPSLASSADRIAYRPPAPDPTDYVDRPIQIFGVQLHARHDLVARVVGVHARIAGGARRIRRDGSPCSSCRRTRAPDAADSRSRSRPGQNQAIWVEVYIDRVRKPGRYRGTIEIRADAARRTLPIELEVYDFALPDENSMHAMLYYSSDQAELYQGRNLDPAFHRLAHRHRVELVHAYDEQTIQKRVGPLLGDGLHARRAGSTGRAPASATSSRRARSTVPAVISTSDPAPGREATRG